MNALTLDPSAAISFDMSDQFPVTVAVTRNDGSVEQVRIGTATKTAEGFSLSMGQLSIGSTPSAAPRAAAAPSAVTWASAAYERASATTVEPL